MLFRNVIQSLLSPRSGIAGNPGDMAPKPAGTQPSGGRTSGRGAAAAAAAAAGGGAAGGAGSQDPAPGGSGRDARQQQRKVSAGTACSAGGECGRLLAGAPMAGQSTPCCVTG